MKAIVPRDFPVRTFSTEYASEDISYAIDLPREADLAMPGAELASLVLQRAVSAGSGRVSSPVVDEVVSRAWSAYS